jgi:hypothetical protein
LLVLVSMANAVLSWSLSDSDRSYEARGSFRTNIEEFVGFFGTALDLKKSNVEAWSVNVVTDEADAAPLTLLVCQEDATQDPPVCDQCRIIGEQIYRSLNCFAFVEQPELLEAVGFAV